MYEEQFENSFISAVLNQYLIALGEFGFDTYALGTENSTLVWILFIFCTLFSQILILNMLIAIMGDTFDRVTEKRKEAALFEKIQIIDDYIDLIRIQDNDKKQFVYSANPIDKDED